MFSHASRGRLTGRDLDRFSTKRLFDRVARAVCRAECVPRKELYEAWEVARRVRRLLRGGRVVDLGAGHGLLAHVMLVLDDSSPNALSVDRVIPPSNAALHRAMTEEWPRLAGRVTPFAGQFDAVDLLPTDVVVSIHACGALTDRALERAIASRARIAVLPCCHDFERCDAGPLAGWIDRTTAIDAMRAVRLEAAGFRVWTQTIPGDITPKNRLLIGEPRRPC